MQQVRGDWSEVGSFRALGVSLVRGGMHCCEVFTMVVVMVAVVVVVVVVVWRRVVDGKVQ